MPAPVVAAVMALIAREGVKAAAKKYGTTAVKQAQKELSKRPELKKHLDDVVQGKNPGQLKIEKAARGTEAVRSGERRGVMSGAAAGGAVTAAVMNNRNKSEPEKSVPAKKMTTPKSQVGGDSRTNPKDYPEYQKKTESAATFRKMYAEAKKAGKKTFTYEGRRYTTD